jgi:hypothetical protein
VIRLAAFALLLAPPAALAEYSGRDVETCRIELTRQRARELR